LADNTIELIVKTTDQASQGLKAIAGQVDHLGSAAETLKSVFEGAIAGFTLDKLVESITGAQQATADLDRQFSIFGATVGVTEEDMNAFAESASKASTLTSESLKEAQANLLNYTTVTGQSFLDARDLIVDLAAKMGGDAAQAATLLGRALQNPVSGIRLLAQVGVTLTQSQRETIASLEQTGGAAQATAFIMDTLKQHLQGAADAATNTLGGALTQLKNSFLNGFTGAGSDLEGLTDSIHQLNAEVNDPDFQKALQGVTSFIVDISSAAIDAVNGIRSLAEGLAHIFNGADTPEGQLEDKKQALEDLIAQPDLDPSAAQDYIKQLADVQAQIDKLAASAATAASNTAGLNADMGGKGFGIKAGAPPALVDQLQRPVTTTARQITTHDLGGASPLDDFYTQELQETNNDLDNKYNDFLKKQVQRQDLVVAGALTAAKAQQENNEDFDDLFAPIKVSAKKMQEPLDDIDKQGKEIAQDLTNAFTSFFESGDFSARNFLKTMLTVFDQIVAKAISMDLVNAMGLNNLFDQPNGSGSQVGGLFGALRNLFGGSSGGTTLSGAFSNSNRNSDDTSALLDKGLAAAFGFAAGGGQISGPTVVGEDGPEVFIPGGSGTVMNQRQMAFARGGGGNGLSYAPVYNIELTTDNSDKNMATMVTFLTAKSEQDKKDFKRQLARNGYPLK
jgi:phage-related minor tail protein